jgi:crotonobetainyl-CoA:carnitine CoA-transferase CaiB-like acyl-CoA transferase
MTTSPYPLAGITVVDLSQIYNGPYATFLMAQAGADVIKVEPKNGEHCAAAVWSAARRCRSRCSTPTSARSRST